MLLHHLHGVGAPARMDVRQHGRQSDDCPREGMPLNHLTLALTTPLNALSVLDEATRQWGDGAYRLYGGFLGLRHVLRFLALRFFGEDPFGARHHMFWWRSTATPARDVLSLIDTHVLHTLFAIHGGAQ